MKKIIVIAISMFTITVVVFIGVVYGIVLTNELMNPKAISYHPAQDIAQAKKCREILSMNSEDVALSIGARECLKDMLQIKKDSGLPVMQTWEYEVFKELDDQKQTLDNMEKLVLLFDR